MNRLEKYIILQVMCNIESLENLSESKTLGSMTRRLCRCSCRGIRQEALGEDEVYDPRCRRRIQLSSLCNIRSTQPRRWWWGGRWLPGAEIGWWSETFQCLWEHWAVQGTAEGAFMGKRWPRKSQQVLPSLSGSFSISFDRIAQAGIEQKVL